VDIVKCKEKKKTIRSKKKGIDKSSSNRASIIHGQRGPKGIKDDRLQKYEGDGCHIEKKAIDMYKIIKNYYTLNKDPENEGNSGSWLERVASWP